MKYEIKTASIEKRLPANYSLPASFESFVEACRQSQRGDLGWFAIKYAAPKTLLGFDPKQVVVPCLSLPDGGLVAFWFDSARPPAIVSIGHDGDSTVIGTSWPDFLARLRSRKTKVPDLDDREVKEFPKIRGLPARLNPLAKKRREWNQWLEENSETEPAVSGDESERIRRELVKLTKRHLKDEDDWCDLYVTFTTRSFKVDWADGGIKPYPNAQRLKPVLQSLVDMLGRSLKKSAIVVNADGSVFVEDNLCLGDSRFYEDIQ